MFHATMVSRPRLALALAAVLALGCATHPVPVSPARSGSRTTASMRVMSLPQSIEGTAPTRAPVGCFATLRAEAHLRPRPTVRSEGSALPAGTTLAVFAVDPSVHRRSPGTEDHAIFARARVAPDGAAGWTFIRYVEMADTCPLLVAPRASAQPASESPWECRQPQREFVRAGFFRTRNGPIRCGWGPHDEVVGRVDVDGDGTRDEVLFLSRYLPCLRAERLSGDYEGAYVARWQTPQGWTSAFLQERVNGDRPWRYSGGFDGAITAGRGTYFRTSGSSDDDSAGCSDLPARVESGVASVGFSRLHPCGEVVGVTRFVEPLADGCTYVGMPDESVEIRCARPARTLRLRWDAASFRLVPEGETQPRFEGTELCRHEWDRR